MKFNSAIALLCAVSGIAALPGQPVNQPAPAPCCVSTKTVMPAPKTVTITETSTSVVKKTSTTAITTVASTATETSLTTTSTTETDLATSTSTVTATSTSISSTISTTTTTTTTTDTSALLAKRTAPGTMFHSPLPYPGQAKRDVLPRLVEVRGHGACPGGCATIIKTAATPTVTVCKIVTTTTTSSTITSTTSSATATATASSTKTDSFTTTSTTLTVTTFTTLTTTTTTSTSTSTTIFTSTATVCANPAVQTFALQASGGSFEGQYAALTVADITGDGLDFVASQALAVTMYLNAAGQIYTANGEYANEDANQSGEPFYFNSQADVTSEGLAYILCSNVNNQLLCGVNGDDNILQTCGSLIYLSSTVGSNCTPFTFNVLPLCMNAPVAG